MSKSELKRGQNFLILGFVLCVFGEVQGDATPPALSQVMNTVMHHYMDRVKTAATSGSSTAQLPETRGGHGGGYGGGHGQGHGNGYGAITLDPVSIISLLALGAFLINNILQLLKANQAPAPAGTGRKLGRSFDKDMDNPSIIADITSETGKYYDKMAREGDSSDPEPSFSKFFENVGSLYYLQPKKRNVCIKKVVCKYVNGQKSREDASGSFKTKVFDFMLTAITRFVAPELSAHIVREDACIKFNKLCSDSILKDAKISVENKVYAEVSSIISSLAIKQLVG